ncbi:MAG: hypothetical protein R2689_03465 [Microthrixaceae bacterium]
MSSRLEIELTSSRPDGTWTWRKAGAKLPKGELPGDVVPAGVNVGDVVRAEADILTDGVIILSVQAPKAARAERFETLEVVGTRRDEPLVTQTLAPKGRGDGRGRGRRRDGDDRGEGRGRRGEGEGRGRRGDGEGRGRRGDGEGRPRRPAPEQRPKPKRLRPARTHRNAVLETLAPEQRPIAEQVLLGGVPAVRQAVDQQNEKNRAAGLPEIGGDELVALAEGLLPKLRSAEWRDRADSAVKLLEELDLRDLRSVVVAADQGARDDESREIATQLREGLTRRVDEEHTTWLAELATTLADGRIVRALRLSSRPPKAGAPIPAELIEQLTTQTTENLTLENSQERWAMVIDALAFSPIRSQITPAEAPAEPTEALKAAVAKVATRVPQIAALLGIEASATKRKRPTKARPPKPAATKPAAEQAAVDEAPTQEVPEAEAPVEAEAPEVEAPVAEAPEIEASVAEALEAEAPVAEAPVAEAPEVTSADQDSAEQDS